MLEILFKSLHRVQIVFAERKRARGGRSPGIHQRHLNDVILVFAVADERAPILHVQVDLRPLIQVVSVIGIPAAHDVVGDDGVDLDGGNVLAAVG